MGEEEVQLKKYNKKGSCYKNINATCFKELNEEMQAEGA